jgi:crotonobetainyl-CoA:carnitine CoA-transferase CaiB-like acyl-CoA transferase
MIEFDATQRGPLDAVRVLDLSRLVAGNMLSLQLADLGAEVMKVEPPHGDPLRDWLDEGEPLFWKTYARNKRSIVLNLRLAAGKEALLRLAARAEVLIENFRPGTLEQMALGPDVLHARNADLILVRISGFGQTGPYAQLPGFGTLVEAMSGLAARTGFPDREPVLPPLALADMIAGLYGANAVTTALFVRERGRARGQIIDVSLLEAMFSVLGPEAAIFRATGKVKERTGSGSSTTAPRNVYRCADGKYVAMSASIQSMAKRVFEMIGRPEMIDDARFRTNSDRVRNRALVDAAVGSWFARRTRAEALEQMRAAGVTVGPVYNIDDAVEDAHFREREILVEVEDPELGSIPMHNIVPRLSLTPGVWRRPAPKLGEHTDVILAEAGYDAEAIAALRREGAAA